MYPVLDYVHTPALRVRLQNHALYSNAQKCAALFMDAPQCQTRELLHLPNHRVLQNHAFQCNTISQGGQGLLLSFLSSVGQPIDMNGLPYMWFVEMCRTTF